MFGPIVKRPGFTFLELLTTLAALVIVIGLMVSLARHVRATSADQITRETLRQLDAAIANYVGKLPPFTGDLPLVPVTEAQVSVYVERSNAVVRALARSDAPVVDAWGNLIGYLAAQNPEIGMAPQNRPFCFSAGPDGRYLTRSDNLYSYEQLRPADVTTPSSTAPLLTPHFPTTSVDRPNN